ncbi:DUF7344 domain-containing protein [Natrarchaeobius chitinivorans]|uniref:DUF7344 domain-containing protein n=1 Tax=Natrarchaeobius chitinivorans TaxID=1679083 RepID=A0A3N6MFS8_NATCH|nr:hypothetical protein [Natrarchaeobius chitinivorans]RQG94441.1 hypothetical protein EA473_12140 [Natrarchaeobius chitinivorans]
MSSYQTPNLDRDAVYSIMANRRRRRVLSRLDENERMTVTELTAELAECESTATDRTGTSTEYRNVRISLVHNHLPRLADHGIVEWEPHEDDAVVAAAFDEHPVLETELEFLHDTG